MIGDPARRKLYEKAIGSMGEEAAAVLMEYLPPMGWTDIATKSHTDTQIDHLREVMEIRFDAFEDKYDARFDAIDRRFNSMDEKIEGTKNELKSFAETLAERQTKALIYAIVAINSSIIGSAFALSRLFR